MTGFFKGAELQQVSPDSILPKCGACGLYKTCKSPKMVPTGKGRKRVLLVGEAPGGTEDDAGVQFVGKTGKYLEDTLRSIGVDMRRDCWITNALICRPPGNEIKDDKAVGYCRPNLLKTISHYKPDVVILLGGMAVKSLIGYLWDKDVGPISRWVGWRIPGQRINAWVCPTYHPSYLMRMENKALDGLFTRHLQQAFRLEGKPWEEVPCYEDQIQVCQDIAQATEFLNNITDGVVAFDYECNMLKPDSDKAVIHTCSVCYNGKETVAFPVWGSVVDALRRLLSDKKVKKVAANMKYEDRFTRRLLGVPVRGWLWDTMLAAHVLDFRPDITSLKFLSFVYLGQRLYNKSVEPYMKSKKKDAGGNEPNCINEVSLDKLLLYNGLDALLTYLVAQLQMKEMRYSK